MPEPTTLTLKRALLEGIVIVLSILLAFGIDATWDSLKEREAERRALDTLTVELKTNLDILQYSVDWLGRNRAAAAQTLEAALSSLAGQPASVPDSVIALAVRVASFSPCSRQLHPPKILPDSSSNSTN